MSFTAWDSVVWPKLMNTMESGMFRIREYKTLLEWTFTPQWRTGVRGSDWQDFIKRNRGRCSSKEVIRFETKEEAEEFIDGAVANQPVLQIHEYTPEAYGGWSWEDAK